MWIGADLATMDEAGGIGHVPDGCTRDSRRAHRLGRHAASSSQAMSWSAPVVTDARGLWITPGLIECHTHLVYAGDRSNEFAARLRGATYEDIARAGGGIVSTMRATRAASEDELLAQSLPRAQALASEGVTTLEVKSGYGLDLASELKMLRVAQRIGEQLGIDVVKTFLGAHALPPEFANRQDDYVRHVCDDMLPAVAAERLAEAADVFCERIAFTREQTERVFERARSLGLALRLHADQLSDGGGGEIAARYGALSADHLEYASDTSLQLMARSGVVAGLLPGAFYFLRETPLAADRTDARARRPDGGVDGLQPRDVADRVAPAGDEHGVRAVPHDCDRSASRRDGQRSARAWDSARIEACCARGCARTLRSGSYVIRSSCAPKSRSHRPTEVVVGQASA